MARGEVSPGVAMAERERDGAGLSRGLEWTLRVGAFLCFAGHGAFGLITKEAWIPYFAVAGIGHDMAFRLMPLVGTMDIFMGCVMLVRPRPAVAYWMVAWAVWTALLRPLSGEPGWEALERGGDYGVPAALAVLMVPPRVWRDVFLPARFRLDSEKALGAARWVLTIAVSLLMLGHGALGVMGKRGITTNFASVMPGDVAPMVTVYAGWLEIVLAAVVLVRRPVALLVFVAAWKLATESLFLAAGAPVWEVVERGGSYAAPIALAIVEMIGARQSTRNSR
ncbi:MAG: hypothetical protein ACREPM_13640 [Gemmatimonadaceae bacterium]